MSPSSLNTEELAFITEAAAFLEHPSASIKFMNMLGKPVDALQKQIPAPIREKLSIVVEKALKNCLEIAISTVHTVGDPLTRWPQSVQKTNTTRWTHAASAAATGAAGGFLGPLTLMLELPVSTGIMMRGISSVASEWGHDLKDPQVQLECLYVFTLGSRQSKDDDQLDASYLTSRVAFARMLQEAARFLHSHGTKAALGAIGRGKAPILLQFISRVGALFEITVSERILAKAVPVVGSLGGAAVNAVFCNYFISAARYHFGLMHLEKKYGAQRVEESYAKASQKRVPRPHASA